jgi:nucleotide-binding universal stress UspA family protein
MIVANDGSTEADAVIRGAERRPWPEKTEAHIVSVVQTLVPKPDPLEANTFAREPAFAVIRDADERERVRLQNVAESSANRLRHAGLTTTATVVDGEPGQVIVAEANRLNADAILMGARGLGRMERFLLGSVSSHIATHAQCTVEVVRW